MPVYLLHLDRPLPYSMQAGTRQYLGYATDAQVRIEEYRRSEGARLTQVAVSRGITYWLSDHRIW